MNTKNYLKSLQNQTKSLFNMSKKYTSSSKKLLYIKNIKAEVVSSRNTISDKNISSSSFDSDLCRNKTRGREINNKEHVVSTNLNNNQSNDAIKHKIKFGSTFSLAHGHIIYPQPVSTFN